jgi:hypothetical protein
MIELRRTFGHQGQGWGDINPFIIVEIARRSG